MCVVLWGTAAQGHAAGLPVIAADVFQDQIAAAQQLAQACAGSAAACEGNRLPGREQVAGAAGRDPFAASWEWMRADLATARTEAAPERGKRMQAVEVHLATLRLQAERGETDAAAFSKARAAANAALAREEFRAADGPGFWQRLLARVQDGLLRFFGGVDRLGKRAPWLAPLIEWSCFVLAAAGLLWFVRRSLKRQALRISLSEGAALRSTNEGSSPDWERLADERAAAEDWRGAIHMLYWAAVAVLDRRRAWKPNATRTPREALRLLKPGSAMQAALRELTGSLEQAWYGRHAADAASYQAAQRSLRVLEAAKLERAGESEAGAATGVSLAEGA